MPRTRTIVLPALVVALLSFAFPLAAASRVNCVQYVKQASAFSLSGDAWKWWDNARGKYRRGAQPQAGSVLVFKKSGKLSRGHVALVDWVIDSRTIAIHHANWAPSRGKIYTNVLVRDASPNNDWSQVRVWYDPAGTYGSGYHTYGFIYKAE